MSIPKDITGDELIRILAQYGYEITRQKGSHVRLTTKRGGVHHITIPKHNPLKVGTLNSIINDIADHYGLTKKEVIKDLFS
ncbi:MAG: type II toxin-antitoxin system HicA family toxin [Firmicutes bacterium]|nr:type II toxin-antitoxin system HicA family toxin [Bacillota bacterium]